MNRAPGTIGRARRLSSNEGNARSAATDERFMRMALRAARGALDASSPNPAVGCVIVRKGRLVGKGATSAGGRPHAEANALKAAQARARGATAYVSFEPCSHFGQTPPCARALVEAGVRRVVVGCVDPYPPVRGRGIAALKKAGVEVKVGVLGEQCRALNEGFLRRVARGRPFVLLKLAMSLDGRIAAASGDSRWISSAQSRALVHRWRRECDGVMVGAGTVIADNPRLTCRLRGAADPVRVIVDGGLRSPVGARVFSERSAAGALLVTTPANLGRARRRYRRGRVEFLAVPGHRGEISLPRLVRELGRRGWNKVMIEGGARLAASALRGGVVDRIALFIAPAILGAGLPAIEGLLSPRVRDRIALGRLRVRRSGSDLLVEGEPLHRGRSARPRRRHWPR